MAGYNKIVPGITESSIWELPADIRIVWVTMIAIKDMDGFVKGTPASLARRANVSLERTEEALKVFLSPDPHSGTPDNEGRRIEAVDGGWQVLNSDLYRQEGMTEAQREYWKQKQAEYRKRKKNGKKGSNVKDKSETSQGQSKTSLEGRASAYVSVSVEGECEGEKKDTDYAALKELGADFDYATWLKIKRAHPGADIEKVLLELDAWIANNKGVPENWYYLVMNTFSRNEAGRLKRGQINKQGKEVDPEEGQKMPDYVEKANSIEDPEARREYLAKLQDEGSI